ncbi:MAG: CHRD domain-containing protein [Planctomycetales bacterium]|nr:CHRD domain-containing protein [Planctomycetales bacterium]
MAAREATFVATLSGAATANDSPGVRSAVVIIDFDLNLVTIDVEFSGLVGSATAAHIHAPTTVAATYSAGVATPKPTSVTTAWSTAATFLSRADPLESPPRKTPTTAKMPGELTC